MAILKYLLIFALWAHPSHAANPCKGPLAVDPVSDLVTTIFESQLGKQVSYILRFKAVDFSDSSVQELQDSVAQFGVALRLLRVTPGRGEMFMDIEISGKGRNVVSALVEFCDAKKYQRSLMGWLKRLDAADEQPVLPPPASGDKLEALVRLPVLDLHLPDRVTRVLQLENVAFVGDLVQHSAGNLMRMSMMTRAHVREIVATLMGLGLKLGMFEPPGWPYDIDAVARSFAMQFPMPTFSIADWAVRTQKQAGLIFSTNWSGLMTDRPAAAMTNEDGRLLLAMVESDYFYQARPRGIARHIRYQSGWQGLSDTEERDLARKLSAWQKATFRTIAFTETLGTTGAELLYQVASSQEPVVIASPTGRKIVIIPLRNLE